MCTGAMSLGTACAEKQLPDFCLCSAVASVLGPDSELQQGIHLAGGKTQNKTK